MIDLRDFFNINISADRMMAELVYTEEYLANQELEVTAESVMKLLAEYNIKYGIQQSNLDRLLSDITLDDFPLMIAKGKEPIHGIDGKVDFKINFHPEIEKTDNWNFRDVMQIPSVEKGDKLVEISMPTNGVEGIDVYGKVVSSRPGKPINLKPGKNVRYEEESQSFFAEEVGQASMHGNLIQVHPVYEVTDTLSMKEGNLDFPGTIVIRGNVPSGFRVHAGGDVKIYGMVEAATILANGSVYISEGFSGLHKGFMKAGENIHIGYINQGMVQTAGNLYVENSILHSDCVVGRELVCERGSIIGGQISAGESIQVKHVGNQMNTKTVLVLGRSHKELEKLEKLEAEKKELEDTLEKLSIIGDKLSQTPNLESNPQLVATLKRQKASYDKNQAQLNSVNEQLRSMASNSDLNQAKLTVTGNLYGNTTITFGKYTRVMNTEHAQVEFELLRNEIYMRSI
ncbi:FapA family protein [Ornithinibacillus sp. FSL M8-0202]|uniref:DUF342 domain-containing protein n=1 Tax=unclassified Ornithinibacillus TaxID=2620869 RepID=UPI0030CABB4A